MESSYPISPSVNTPPALRLVRDEEAPPYDGQPSRQREPFVMISHEVFREYAHKAGPAAWSVFTCLVFHADADGTCFPAHATIGSECGIKTRHTVIAAIKRLSDLGMVAVESRRQRSGAATSNVYKILVGMPVQNLHTPVPFLDTTPPKNCTPPVQKTAHELEPLNYNHLTKTENTPLPPKGERAPKKPTYAPAFEAFWTAYPSGNGNKKQAGAQWDRLAPDDALLAAIMAGLDRWKASGRWQRGYVKAAEIWIRDRWWENDPPADRAEVPATSHRHNGKDIGISTSDLVAMLKRGETP